MRQDSLLKLCDGLSVMQTCVWSRIAVVKKHFCHIFMGMNPPEKLLQLFQSFHIDVQADRLAFARCIVAVITVVDGRPKRGRSDTLPCPCSDDAIHFAQRLMVLLFTAMSP
jgi:hypothetical protein